jgi:hypothetical protein
MSRYARRDRLEGSERAPSVVVMLKGEALLAGLLQLIGCMVDHWKTNRL